MRAVSARAHGGLSRDLRPWARSLQRCPERHAGWRQRRTLSVCVFGFSAAAPAGPAAHSGLRSVQERCCVYNALNPYDPRDEDARMGRKVQLQDSPDPDVVTTHCPGETGHRHRKPGLSRPRAHDPRYGGHGRRGGRQGHPYPRGWATTLRAGQRQPSGLFPAAAGMVQQHYPGNFFEEATGSDTLSGRGTDLSLERQPADAAPRVPHEQGLMPGRSGSL